MWDYLRVFSQEPGTQVEPVSCSWLISEWQLGLPNPFKNILEKLQSWRGACEGYSERLLSLCSPGCLIVAPNRLKFTYFCLQGIYEEAIKAPTCSWNQAYMCVYIYTYTYTHIYMHTYIHIYIYITLLATLWGSVRYLTLANDGGIHILKLP